MPSAAPSGPPPTLPALPDGRASDTAAAVDEMVDGHGRLLPHWRGLLDSLSGLESATLARRAQRLERLAGDDGGAPVWRCDPVPLPLAAGEFTLLERGLQQRARLLEAILADLYGPQSILADGALPPALAFANPAFLRACRAQPAAHPAPRFLHCYAADLVRGPDGAWRVLADRTGGALGIGYARESRRLLARVLPELFRTTQVRQLRPFFDLWQDALLGAAPPTPGRTPVAALLTPGVRDPHWPEHLALSRDLSCVLVEARDLAVRAGALCLQTLRGPRQVDVLLRRVPGEALDPLEMPATAPGGVPGLLLAARQGAVRILNHPGAGAIEAPGLAAFMPALCRRLLGEPLRLATVPTMWLADEGAQRTLVQGLNRWVVRPALDPAAPPTSLGGLSAGERAELAAEVAQHPWRFAACTAVTPSVAPCHFPAGLAPAPVVLRLFLVHDGAGWRMMQGGLARVLRPGEHVTEALPPGAVFKDVWVLADEGAVISGPGPAPQAPVPLQRGTGTMPGRAGTNFFRLGQQVERLGTLARLGRAGLLRRARGAPLPRELVELDVLGRCLSATGLAGVAAEVSFDDAVRAALLGHGAGMAALDEAARLLEALRDRLPTESHGLLTRAIHAAGAEVHEGLCSGVDGLIDALAGLHRLSVTTTGVAADSMVRDGGRLFLDLGRGVERAQLTAVMLAAVLDQPPARMDGALTLALELCDSGITYRTRYLSVLQPAPVLDLVLADIGNPRALATQFACLERRFAALGDAALASDAAGLLRRTTALAAGVAEAADPAAATAALPGSLNALASAAAALSVQAGHRAAAPLPPPRADAP